jgi:hypothetical protein
VSVLLRSPWGHVLLVFALVILTYAIGTLVVTWTHGA